VKPESSLRFRNYGVAVIPDYRTAWREDARAPCTALLSVARPVSASVRPLRGRADSVGR
jgi:hypothetical protein